MGLYDRVRIEDGLDVELPGLPGDPTAVDWQTKSIDRPALEVYKITMEGRLYREDARHETVPEEERPLYDEEIGGFENEWHELCGLFEKVPEGWTDTCYHGIVEFHAHVDDEGYSYEAKFTDGDLVDVECGDRW